MFTVTIPNVLLPQPVRPPRGSIEQAPKSSTPAHIKLSPGAPLAPVVPDGGVTRTHRSSSVVSSVVAAVRKHYCALLLILLAAALGVWIWGVTLSGRVTGCKGTVTGIALIVSHITLGITLLAAVAVLIAKRKGWGAQSSTVLRILKVAVAAALVIATAACGYVLHTLHVA
jgi:hypothetical protein